MLHELFALITETEAALLRVNEPGMCQQIKRKNAMNKIVAGYFSKPVHAQVKSKKVMGIFNLVIVSLCLTTLHYTTLYKNHNKFVYKYE